MELLLCLNNVHDRWKDGPDTVTLLWMIPCIRFFHKLISGWWNYSLRKLTNFPPVDFAPPKNNVCETEPKNDFLTSEVLFQHRPIRNHKIIKRWYTRALALIKRGRNSKKQQIWQLVHREALSTLWGPCFGVWGQTQSVWEKVSLISVLYIESHQSWCSSVYAESRNQ